MALEQVGVDQVMRAMAAHPEVWVSGMPELAEIAALLHGDNMRRAIEVLEKLGFVVAREMPDAQ